MLLRCCYVDVVVMLSWCYVVLLLSSCFVVLRKEKEQVGKGGRGGGSKHPQEQQGSQCETETVE